MCDEKVVSWHPNSAMFRGISIDNLNDNVHEIIIPKWTAV